MKEMRLETTDRLSNLPKHILDDILSRLPEEDVARTRILSKAWNDTSSTSPNLRFSQHKYIFGVRKNDGSHQNEILPMPIVELERKRNKFADHVEKTLTRFHDQCLAIREFKLHMNCSGSQSMYRRIDHWMRLVVEGGVQELNLLLSHDRETWYECAVDHCCFPPSILEAKSLIKLTLMYGKIDHSLVNNPVQFSSLQKLSLSYLTVKDEQVIQNIISSCPLIEYLSLLLCHMEGQNNIGLKSIRIHGLCKLKTVRALMIQEIDIDAPNLEYLEYAPSFSNIPFKTNMDKCKNLKTLSLSHLRSIIITDKWLFELLLKFPLLERLRLARCNFSEKIKVSSAHLKVLEFLDYFPSSILKEVHIDAPNLRSLKYDTSAEMPTLSFLSNSNLLQIELNLLFVSYWDFEKLRQFLQSFGHRSILSCLSIKIDHQYNKFDIDALGDVSEPPPSIKHLNLWIDPKLQTYVLHLVTSLLCSCCPTAIHVRHDYKISDTVIETLCDILRSGKHECYCSPRDIKCWWHILKGLQLTKSIGEVIDETTIQLEY
ncbi:hypothetical protein L6164_003057 [Bauhinia variegata]|uniref:Uncharacterized protein n=1 Tax=Bauhinia variegata TaxID=167791 RepID=A0ACB9PZA1_BAUVA|nr:hypothetical protein L6164_003057 [Bauhinia variegata]